MVFLIQVMTEAASVRRKGGSIRMAELVPVMRVVTLERPRSEALWMCVSRGIFGVRSFSFPLLLGRWFV